MTGESIERRSSTRHINAFIAALAALPLAVLLSFPLLELMERPFMRHLLAEPFPAKNQGMLLQREALLHEDVVSVYGSSELVTEVDHRPDDFFRMKPSGFQVCPVGAGGNHTLLSAEKIAAQGAAVRGQQVVIILSPNWFQGEIMHPNHVAGNFSPLQTIALLHTSALDAGIRKRLVKRILDYPSSLAPHPILGAYVRAMSRDGRAALWTRRLLRPCIEVYRIRLEWEDHLNTLSAAFKMLGEGLPKWKHEPEEVDWDSQIAQLEAEEEREIEAANRPPHLVKSGDGDEQFMTTMGISMEWDDFALLLDTLKDLHAKVLVIGIPFPGAAQEARGVSTAARKGYYRKVEAMSVERGFAAVTFSDHDMDTNFLIGKSSHLEKKGWLYVNKLLNEFHNGRLRRVATREGVALPDPKRTASRRP